MPSTNLYDIDILHVFTKEAVSNIQKEFANDRNWLAFNKTSFLIREQDLNFFKSTNEMADFMRANKYKWKFYDVIKINSIEDAIYKIALPDANVDRKTLFRRVRNFILYRFNNKQNKFYERQKL